MTTNGQRFRAMRQKLGVTQKQMAALILVDERTVQRWECEERVCPNNVIKLVEMLVQQLIQVQ